MNGASRTPQWTTTVVNEARAAIDSLLLELGLDDYVFDVEPRHGGWEVRIDRRTPGGWRAIELRADGDLLVAARRDPGARRRILEAWRIPVARRACTPRVMRRLRCETRNLLDATLRRMTYALEETRIEHERRHLQQELLALELARADIEGMSIDDLELLHARLAEPPPSWVARSERRA
jgi:hypothetical protein